MRVLNKLNEYACNLQDLAYSDYFSTELSDNAHGMAEICQFVVANESKCNEFELNRFYHAVNKIRLHLEGSTKSQLPYTIDNCLTRVIKDWCNLEDYAVSHAYNDDDQFYCDHLSWDIVLSFNKKFTPEIHLSKHVVLIETPRAFKNLPLFCTALYHEVAHFLDRILGISETVHSNDKWIDRKTFKTHPHYAEHFSDFLAANYIGETIAEVLTILDPGAEESHTHPATSNRVEFIRKFVRGEEFESLEVFQQYLMSQRLPQFKRRYDEPDIQSCFDDARPYEIQNVREMHGIWGAGWKYYADVEAGRKLKWPEHLTKVKRIGVVNDLLEKSVSDFIAKEKLAELKKANGESLTQEVRRDLHGVSITPLLESSQIGDSTVDLRLGLNFLVPVQSLNLPIIKYPDTEGYDSLSRHFQEKRKEIGERFILNPNQLLLGVTMEYVAMPNNFRAEVTIDSSFETRGISFRTRVVPGYRGCIPIEIINCGSEPVELTVGDRMFRMSIEKVNGVISQNEFNDKHFALVKPDLRRLSDNISLEQLMKFV